MPMILKATLLVATAALLGACAQQEEPVVAPAPVLEPEPTFSKF